MAIVLGLELHDCKFNMAKLRHENTYAMRGILTNYVSSTAVVSKILSNYLSLFQNQGMSIFQIYPCKNINWVVKGLK